MGNFEIKSSNLQSTYNYENDDVNVTGGFRLKTEGNAFVSDDGNITDKQGRFVANFNGSMNPDGKIIYNISGITADNSEMVWGAIEDIEANILGKN